MKYKAKEIKYWNTDSLIKGNWVPARPVTNYNFWERLKISFFVLIGKYDALDWEEK